MRGFIVYVRRAQRLSTYPRTCGDLSLDIFRALGPALIPAYAGIYRVGRGRKYSVIILIPARAGIYHISNSLRALQNFSYPRVRVFIVSVLIR